MSNQTAVHIGENSPEQVAYKLLKDVARVEKKLNSSFAIDRAERAWILDTYAECLQAVTGNRK